MQVCGHLLHGLHDLAQFIFAIVPHIHVQLPKGDLAHHAGCVSQRGDDLSADDQCGNHAQQYGNQCHAEQRIVSPLIRALLTGNNALL
ncbi:hypothetical protein D3C76_724370 [compost metagenome]